MHQSQLHSVDELKKRLLDVWHDVMDQSVIDDALTGGISVFEHVCGKRRTFQAIVVNFTIAVSAEPHDKIYFVSSNTTFVICRKFELQLST